MNVTEIRNIGVRTFNTAKGVANRAYGTLKNTFDNPAAVKNFKKALPGAGLAVGAFSMMALLPNRKLDGKQGRVEKKSGSLAAIVFALSSFKKFFNVENKKVADVFSGLKKKNASELYQSLKTNKSNVVLFLASIIGVKLLTNITTKGLDGIVNEVFDAKKLEE